MSRLRILGWTVIPSCLIDDGENLSQVQPSPINIPNKDWEAFVTEGWKDHLDLIRTQNGIPPEAIPDISD